MATAWRRAKGTIVALAIAPAVFAQLAYGAGADKSQERLRFSGYAIEGQALLSAEDHTRIVAPYFGRDRSLADVVRARAALQQAYHDLGHCSVRVELSNPAVADGVATFRLTRLTAPDAANCLPTVATDGFDGSGRVPAGDNTGRVVQSFQLRDMASVRPAGVSGVRSNDFASGPAPAVAGTVNDGHGQGLGLSLGNSGPRTVPVSGVFAGDEATEKRSPVMLAMSGAVVGSAVLAGPVRDAGSVLVRQLDVPAQAESARTFESPATPRRAVQLAQAPAAPGTVVPVAPIATPKFEIRRYVVDGNTLIKPERIERLLAPFTGMGKDFGDVQRALEALQGAYQAAGYGSVEIRLPEQELERGEVRFVAIEARIGRITIEGNEHFSSANIQRAVPTLREGVTPNSHDIAKSIRLANENPAKQSTVLLKGSEKEGQIDATIRVADIKPSRYSISFDNTGNENTGRTRLGLAYQHANLFDRDHVLTAQFLTSPANVHDVSVYGVGYRIPLYARGDSVDLVVGYSDVDSGVVQDLFNVTGKGTVYAVRYNHGLAKWGDVEHKLTYGLDYRAYQNNVKPVGGVANLIPDVTVHPLSVTYLASLKQEQRELSVFLSYVQNVPGMNDGTDDIFKKARFQVGTAGYRLFRFGGSYSRSFLGDWQARIRLDAQYTEDTLVTGEQFAIGGADNVRGFNERFTSNDKGYRTNWEIYSPDLAKRLGFGDGRLRFLTFYDTGASYRNQPVPGELEAASLDSWGMGMRLSYKNFFSARLDVAHILHDGSEGLFGNGRRNVKKIHLSTAWVW